MKLDYEVITLRTNHRFTIARAGHAERCAVWVRLTGEDGLDGWGEADPCLDDLSMEPGLGIFRR